MKLKSKIYSVGLMAASTVLTACSQQPMNTGYSMYGMNTMMPQALPQQYWNGNQPQYQQAPYPQQQFSEQFAAPLPEDHRTPLQRIQDMSGGEDLYNGESNHQSNTQFSREEVNEYIRSVERDLQVRDGSRSSSRTTTGTSVNAAVAKTISDAEAASRSSSDENNECTTGSCPSRKRTEVPANADQSLRKEESTTIEEVKSEPVKKEPAFVLDPAVYSTYIQKMLPNYASESLSQLTVEKLTFRNLLEAGKAYTQLTTDHPGMAACIKQKGNQAMAQLEENYPVIHQSELEEQQRLSAQIAKAEAKLTKIKDPKKQEKERKAAMAKIWKSFDEQKLVDYYLGAGVDADQILMRATPDLESLIDSVEGCIADEKKAVGAQS